MIIEYIYLFSFNQVYNILVETSTSTTVHGYMVTRNKNAFHLFHLLIDITFNIIIVNYTTKLSEQIQGFYCF